MSRKNFGRALRELSGTVKVSLPDLLETSVSQSPDSVIPGASLSVTDAAKNQGIVATSKSSTTCYYLSSTNPVKDGTSKLLMGSWSVPALAAGATSCGTVTVTVPSTPALGTYYLLGCADDLNAVAETVETNNWKASGKTVRVIAP